MIRLVLTILLVFAISLKAKADSPHNRIVRQTGIKPLQVGRFEGVGRSTRSYADAVRNACYWGKKVPISIQYSKTGKFYNAVVRYR